MLISSRPTCWKGVWSTRRARSKPGSMSGGRQEALTSQRRPREPCCWECFCGRTAFFDPLPAAYSGSVRSELIERADRNHLHVIQFLDVDILVLGADADAEHAESGADPEHRSVTVETGFGAADGLVQVVFHAAKASEQFDRADTDSCKCGVVESRNFVLGPRGIRLAEVAVTHFAGEADDRKQIEAVAAEHLPCGVGFAECNACRIDRAVFDLGGPDAAADIDATGVGRRDGD